MLYCGYNLNIVLKSKDLKTAAAGSAPPAFDQISAAAALNGVSSSSINPVALLSYLTAAAATSSSPSPSPNTIVNPATSQGWYYPI